MGEPLKMFTLKPPILARHTRYPLSTAGSNAMNYDAESRLANACPCSPSTPLPPPPPGTQYNRQSVQVISSFPDQTGFYCFDDYLTAWMRVFLETSFVFFSAWKTVPYGPKRNVSAHTLQHHRCTTPRAPTCIIHDPPPSSPRGQFDFKEFRKPVSVIVTSNETY